MTDLAQNPEYGSKLEQMTVKMTRMVEGTDSSRFPPRLRMEIIPKRQASKD
ncbi:hypothetical protein [Novipirellula herctigrandis]|uniref:hypothetical protein n=1 Tax=Novipirellula herctigrandis TaxID=2527986 RepID=UPI003AF3FA80